MSTKDSRAYVPTWHDPEVRALRDLAGTFFTREVVEYREKWEAQHYVDREVWRKAGDLGLLCCSIPDEYGGGGGTLAHDLAVLEAQTLAGDTSLTNIVHSGIAAHYLLAYGTEEQKHRWLPGMARGELIAAIAMTEPGAGSDLKAIRTKAVLDGDHYVIDGAKTFISNGALADLVIVVAKTDPQAGARGVSLIVVETADAEGFVRGKHLEKIGQQGADIVELSFEELRVPARNLIGDGPGQGFGQLMSQLIQERLLVGVVAVATMESALAHTVAYVKSREAFSQTLWDFQNTRFVLAEVATKAHAGRVFLDSCVDRHLRGGLEESAAAMAKWWLSEQQGEVVDACLQLFGGYGYIREYPIARMFTDSRVTRIYGGSNEIMKELVARSL